MAASVRSLRARVAFTALNLLLAALVLVAVFVGLPLRYWVVDVGAVGLATALALASVCQWLGHRVARTVHLVALVVVLATGLGAVLALATAFGALEGVHGPMADGSRLIVLLTAALLVPYTLVLPGVQLAAREAHK